MYTSVIVGPILYAFVALHPIPTAAVATSSVASPGEQFAGEIAERSSAGWRLGNLDFGYTDETVRVSMLMVGPEQARWLNLVFDAEGAEPVAFSSLRASIPKHVRFYPGEADIVAAMATAPPNAIYDECGMLHLDNGADGVTLDEYDYYEMSARVAGDRAPAALSDALASALESGYQLVAINPAHSSATGVHIELDGDERLVLAVDLDTLGRVVAVETRKSPSTHVWQTYARDAELTRALRASSTVERISTSPGMISADEATFVLGEGGHYSIAIDDFDPADFECPC
jgi:hypothetical protein